jgi:hypothetical protein
LILSHRRHSGQLHRKAIERRAAGETLAEIAKSDISIISRLS